MYNLSTYFVFLFLFFLSCNYSFESGTKKIYNSNELHQYGSTKNTQRVISTQDQKHLTESDAYSFLLERLLDRGLGKSCVNILPKNNIDLLDRLTVETSENSKSEYSNYRLKTKFILYHIRIYECFKVDQNATYSSRNPKYWGFVQNGINGEIVKEFSSFPQIVNTYLINELRNISGFDKNIDDSSVNVDIIKAEEQRKLILKNIQQ